jgi:cell division protease FtsH
MALLFLQAWWGTARVTEIVPYSELERALEQGRVERVVVTEKHIMGYLKAPSEQGKRVLAANLVEPELAARLSRFNVPYTREHESNFFTNVISWVAPALVFFAVWISCSATSPRSRAWAA